MALHRMVFASLLALMILSVLPSGVVAGDGEIAEAGRKPGGINPADIDWPCSIMAGRTDRAFIPCAALVEPEPFRTKAVQFLIDNPPPARGPLRIYTDEEAQALGLLPGPGGAGPYRRR